VVEKRKSDTGDEIQRKHPEKKKPTQNSILKQPYENVQGKKVKAEIS